MSVPSASQTDAGFLELEELHTSLANKTHADKILGKATTCAFSDLKELKGNCQAGLMKLSGLKKPLDGLNDLVTCLLATNANKLALKERRGGRADERAAQDCPHPCGLWGSRLRRIQIVSEPNAPSTVVVFLQESSTLWWSPKLRLDNNTLLPSHQFVHLDGRGAAQAFNEGAGGSASRL